MSLRSTASGHLHASSLNGGAGGGSLPSDRSCARAMYLVRPRPSQTNLSGGWAQVTNNPADLESVRHSATAPLYGCGGASWPWEHETHQSLLEMRQRLISLPGRSNATWPGIASGPTAEICRPPGGLVMPPCCGEYSLAFLPGGTYRRRHEFIMYVQSTSKLGGRWKY